MVTLSPQQAVCCLDTSTVYFADEWDLELAIATTIMNYVQTVRRCPPEDEFSHGEIRVLMYKFSSTIIARALVDAVRHDVKVWVMLDADETENAAQKKTAQTLARAGVQVCTATMLSKCHHKICVLGKDILIDGSVNWIPRGILPVKPRGENVAVTADAVCAAKVIDYMNKHFPNGGKIA